MDALSYKTKSASKATVTKEWVVVDADCHNLGRLASKVAMILRGKYKPSYTPHVDCGDNVIVINSEKINLTGTKMDDKIYMRHTGYPGGQRTLTAKVLQSKNPALLVEKAVKGMLPKQIRSRTFQKFKCCCRFRAQTSSKPKTVNLNDLK